MKIPEVGDTLSCKPCHSSGQDYEVSEVGTRWVYLKRGRFRISKLCFEGENWILRDSKGGYCGVAYLSREDYDRSLLEDSKRQDLAKSLTELDVDKLEIAVVDKLIEVLAEDA